MKGSLTAHTYTHRMGSSIPAMMIKAGKENESEKCVMLLCSKVKFPLQRALFFMLNYILVFLLYSSFITSLLSQCLLISSVSHTLQTYEAWPPGWWEMSWRSELIDAVHIQKTLEELFSSHLVIFNYSVSMNTPFSARVSFFNLMKDLKLNLLSRAISFGSEHSRDA